MRTYFFASLLLPFLSTFVLSAPDSKSPRLPLHIPIQRRAGPKVADFESFLRKAAKTEARYGVVQGNAGGDSGSRRKRAGEITLINKNDSEFFGAINIGTPEKSFNVIMDTGSADLVIASSACVNCPPAAPLYAAPSSSTSKILGTPFEIIYGTGTAHGVLVQDTVSIAGTAISGQTFADCNNIDNLLTGAISGLLGLGFRPLAASGATPLVEALALAGELPEQIFSFALLTYSTIQQFYDQQAGGVMTVGGTNSSYFQGTINWIPITQPAIYWKIPLQDVQVEGKSLNISDAGVVIDTGTSLIGGPAIQVAAIYAAIPGSQAVTYQNQSGYYSYPCPSVINLSFTFGGISYAVPNATFNAGVLNSTTGMCLGIVFHLQTTSSITWIFGDAFLTGVYSAFRFSNLPAVGFALRGTGGVDSNSTSSLPHQANTNEGVGLGNVELYIWCLVALVGLGIGW